MKECNVQAVCACTMAILAIIGVSAKELTRTTQMPIDRLQRIGKMDVLSGRMQISHYGKDELRWGSIANAYLGEATYKFSVDFSRACLTNECIVLPKMEVWCQLEEDKTRPYKEKPWATGYVGKGVEVDFANKQISYIDAKSKAAVRDEMELARQAREVAKRIARAYLLAWGEQDNVRIEFKEEWQ